MKATEKESGEGISLAEFLVRTLAAVYVNMPKEALDWKIERIRNKVGR